MWQSGGAATPCALLVGWLPGESLSLSHVPLLAKYSPPVGWCHFLKALLKLYTSYLNAAGHHPGKASPRVSCCCLRWRHGEVEGSFTLSLKPYCWLHSKVYGCLYFDPLTDGLLPKAALTCLHGNMLFIWIISRVFLYVSLQVA